MTMVVGLLGAAPAQAAGAGAADVPTTDRGRVLELWKAERSRCQGCGRSSTDGQ